MSNPQAIWAFLLDSLLHPQPKAMASSSLFASIGSAFSLVRPSSPPSPHNAQLAAFESSLASQLHRLTPAHHPEDDAEDGIASCAWLCRALEIVLSTHASMESFLPDLHRTLAGGDTTWLDAYLDDSAKCLDICNALKEAMADISNYQASLNAALHSLHKGSLGDSQLRMAKNALRKCTNALMRASHLRSPGTGAGGQHRSKLEKCGSVLRRMGEKLSRHHTSKSSFFVASYATQLTTVFVCGVLTSLLSLRSQRPLSTFSASHHQCSWASSFNTLQHTVKQHVEQKKIKGVVTPLKELEMTHSEACKLYDCIHELLLQKTAATRRGDDFRSHIRSLQASLEDLSRGLSSLEFHVNKVFNVLVASRLALLEVYSQSRCTQSR